LNVVPSLKVMPSDELAAVCTTSFRKMSSLSLSGIAALLRVTVAVPVTIATLPIGSSAAVRQPRARRDRAPVSRGFASRVRLEFVVLAPARAAPAQVASDPASHSQSRPASGRPSERARMTTGAISQGKIPNGMGRNNGRADDFSPARLNRG